MRFLPAIFFTSETSCPAGIFWWTPVLHTPFSLTSLRLHLLVLLSPVQSTWGEREIPLSFDGQHFTWSFLLAAVQFPILGMDCWWMRASTSSL